MDLAIHRHRHFGSNDVILGVGIMVEIEAKEILIRFVDHIRMKRSELPVGTGVAKVEGELSRLDLDGHGVGAGRGEVNIRPSLGAEDAEGEHLAAHQQKSRQYHGLGAAREGLNLFSGTRCGESPDEIAENKL